MPFFHYDSWKQREGKAKQCCRNEFSGIYSMSSSLRCLRVSLCSLLSTNIAGLLFVLINNAISICYYFGCMCRMCYIWWLKKVFYHLFQTDRNNVWFKNNWKWGSGRGTTWKCHCNNPHRGEVIIKCLSNTRIQASELLSLNLYHLKPTMKYL